MDSRVDATKSKEEMLLLWHEYGRQFEVFEPREQPGPTIWEPELPEPDKRGRYDSQVIKHWRMLDLTKRFLQERYAQYSILRTPDLFFDCLVQGYHKPLAIPPEEREFYGWPERGDPAQWYSKAIRMGIFQWQVGFSCRSRGCRRTWCDLHIDNSQRINPADVFRLIAVFEGFGTAKALTEVASWFRVNLKPFELKGKRKTANTRYAVSKQALALVIWPRGSIRRQHVEDFIQEAVDIIRLSPDAEWHPRKFSVDSVFISKSVIKDATLYKIGSPAFRLFFWLHVRQQEEASHNRFGVEISEVEIARSLDVDRGTIRRWRKRLVELGLLSVEGKRWTVGYKIK